MEIVKDIDQHTVCTADPFRGLIVRKTKRENIMIYCISIPVEFSLEDEDPHSLTVNILDFQSADF